MGLLDDAIREHLELKRRHGADPGEVAKQEDEALGPVRRAEHREAPTGTAQAEALSPEHEELLAPDDAWEPEDERGAAPEARAGSRRLSEEPGQDTIAFSLADLEAEEGDADRDEPAGDEPPERPRPRPSMPAGEPEAPAAPPQEPPEGRRRQPAEPLPEPDVVPADEEPGEEDVLDQTPEFLQETPEHDRLWFEQKPPRDFDF
jgi:hypothetical protein